MEIHGSDLTMVFGPSCLLLRQQQEQPLQMCGNKKSWDGKNDAGEKRRNKF
jgi:hypothetical protein